MLPAALFASGLVTLGCTPKIGDSCTVSTNCSASGDRLCDITQPGGYCTIFNCEPDTCPDDSACINFGTVLSRVPGCATSQGNSPYQRSFCMASCGGNGDCRGGYSCQNLSGTTPNLLGAVLADTSGNGMVCVASSEQFDAGAGGAAGSSNQVCIGFAAAGEAGSGD